MDSMNLREMLRVYARKVDFRLSEKYELHTQAQKVNTNVTRYVGNAKNSFCRDNMNIYLRVDSNKVHLQHFGEYCSLANAAAEIFCEKVNNTSLDRLKNLLDLLTLYLKTSNASVFGTAAEFEIIYALVMLPMSATRKRCVILPIEATIDALYE